MNDVSSHIATARFPDSSKYAALSLKKRHAASSDFALK
jgi:hypothetical protein